MIRKKTLSLPSLKTAAEWIGEEREYRPARFSMYREIIPTFRYNKELGLTEKEWRIIFQRGSHVFVWIGDRRILLQQVRRLIIK